MSREIDRRDFRASQVRTDREAALRALAADISERLPGAHQVAIERFDATTGNPAAVVSRSAPAEGDDYVRRALDYVRSIGGALVGLEATQPPEYVPDSAVQRTSSEAATVHLQQQYKGIPIFQAAQAVRFGPRGEVQGTDGSPVTVGQEVDASPGLTVQEAVVQAARHVAVPDADERDAVDQFGEAADLPELDLAGFAPEVVAAFPDRPERPTVLAAGPFADQLRASLTWFPLREDELRLGWQVLLTMPGGTGQYRVIVDAGSGEVLYCHQLVLTVAARGNVFPVDGSSRRMFDFPRPLADYGLLPVPSKPPPGFPDDWVEADSTAGNCAAACLGPGGVPVRGTVGDDGPVFDPADPRGVEQLVVNLFYLNCLMHDWFYLLGFREADGNFQRDNLGRGGVAADRVDARAHPGPVQGTATMRTSADGTRPIMDMGRIRRTGAHTALDSGVVFHEFTHGVTNRLVGGPADTASLEAPQSAGMGEGWSDYIACTINATTVVGAWVTGLPGGIRGFPYDSAFPDTFGDLGTGRYDEVHNIGEIWCATLMEANRQIGERLAVQLVVDALKLSRANPSFLDMRDAILAALDHKLDAGQLTADEHESARRGLWTVFARFGMGPLARSNGPSLFGIQPDFSSPEGPAPEPAVQADDFKRIKGIGRGIERHLHQAGIMTFAQLAALTPAEAVRLAGSVGLSPERVEHQDWIGQARELAGARPARVPDEAGPGDAGPGEEDAVPADRQHYAVFTVELLLDEHSEVRRTRVVHVQERDREGGEDAWAGWEDGRLLRYLVEHAALRLPQQVGAGKPRSRADVRVNVGEGRFEEVLAGSQEPAGSNGGVGRMRARLDFHVSGADAERVAADRPRYFVRVLACVLDSRETTVLAATEGQLEPGVHAQTVAVEFAPPAVGRYQLLGAVVVPDHDVLGVAVGPRLRVVP